MHFSRIRPLVVGLAIAAAPGAMAAAAPIAFTGDPSKAAPALTTGPAAFTADSIQYQNYNRKTNFNDFTTFKQSVVADQYQLVTGFTLGSTTVLANDFNSAYGLYFHVISKFTFPINNLGVTIGPPTYTGLSISLVADVNDDDGVLSTSASRIGFSNATGVANDMTLATGSLISASLSSNPDGSRHNETVTTFTPSAGELGFFGPTGVVILDEIGNSLTTAFSVVSIDSQNFLTLVDGNLSVGSVQLIAFPEPACIILLAVGLFAVTCGRTRRRVPGAPRGRRVERPDSMHTPLIKRLMLGLTLAAGPGAIATAAPIVFTWDPSKATPALTSGPAALSADALSMTNYIRTTNVTNLATLQQTFSGAQIQTINGFTLGGAPVSAPGLNSSYGLYFRISPAGEFPINASGTVIGPAVYSQLDLQLVADVGHDDGAVVDNAAGIGFSNPAGLNNDVVLATGSLLSASLSISPTGARTAHYVTSFQPVASEAAFFAGPMFATNLDIALNTPTAAFQVIPVDALTVLNVVGANGGSTATAQLVPEPASIILLAVGLLAVTYGRTRRPDPGAPGGRRVETASPSTTTAPAKPISLAN